MLCFFNILCLIYTCLSFTGEIFSPIVLWGFVYFGYCLFGNSCWTLSIAFSDSDFFFFFCRFPNDLYKVLYWRYIFTFSPIPFKYFSFHVIYTYFFSGCIFLKLLLDWTHIYCVSCIAGRFFIHWAILKSIKTKSVFR